MKLRILTVVLATLMLLGMLTACVNAPDDQGEQDSANQTEPGNIYDQALSKLTVDWGKEDFVVLGRNDAANSIFEIACMETSTEPLEDSVYYRNLNLAERCNLNYIPKLVSTDELLNVISNDIKSGSGEYAIAFPNMLNAGNLATKNMLVDFNTLEHIDLYAEWWDQGTLDISIAGKTFWMNSDINFLAHDVTFLTMFSKVMAEKQQLNDLYQTVHNQEWTVEVFSSYIKQVSSDANGDGRYDENDSYGLIGTSTMGYNMFYAADLKFVSCNEDGEPYLALTKTDLIKASDLLDQLLDIFYVGNCTYILQPGGEQTAKNMFSRNQGLGTGVQGSV